LWALAFAGFYYVNGQPANYTAFDFLLFGSLISAVDPVAVLAVFQEVQTVNIHSKIVG
jgi:NhaP-type Na+/H+ or K+/H+ antiporter